MVFIILLAMSGFADERARSINKHRTAREKLSNREHKLHWIALNLSVGSDKVEVTELVPNLDSGKEMKSDASGFTNYLLSAENGAITIKVSSIPLLIKEIKDKKLRKERRPILLDSKASPLGLHNAFDARLADLEVDWVRYSGPPGLIWDIIEPEKSKFNWSRLDSSLNETHQHGIHMLVNVTTFNNWDQGIKRDDKRREPGIKLVKDMEAYQSFLEKAVLRYSFVDAWQIENEPNSRFFWNDTPENYLRLLKISYKAIKRANPGALVVIGGVSDPMALNGDFWSKVFLYLEKEGEKERCFDVFDCHWFFHHMRQMENIEQLTDYVQNIKRKLDRIGYQDVPIWMTEMASHSGKPTAIGCSMPEISEKQQASDLVKLYVHALSLGVSKIFWVTLVENHGYGRTPNDYFDNVGLINNPLNDGESNNKIAYYSYKKLAEVLKSFEWKDIKKLKIKDNVCVYKFLNNEQSFYVVWADCAPERYHPMTKPRLRRRP